jgi:hypothetical protein
MAAPDDNKPAPKKKPLSLSDMTPEEAIQRMFASTPLPRKPYCLFCGELDDRVGVINASGDFCCPKCGQVLNSRKS